MLIMIVQAVARWNVWFVYFAVTALGVLLTLVAILLAERPALQIAAAVVVLLQEVAVTVSRHRGR
ncbi:hypothetical protein [Aeromicrobium erythreum]|uniref:Uncharacterized protein n=1 Tax=Aeromicrobium erythreum TaxID=2041 RepID=A0A0U4CRL6_9ACTN|nr:hypothetical protein [Aeromicrobium erythreum]ALX03533.1 hypothetical protein AERYTH_01880 [Aeromicrobium erythreum]